MAPIAPGALAESASAKMRFLYSAEYWRRLALTTTSGSGIVLASPGATLRSASLRSASLRSAPGEAKTTEGGGTPFTDFFMSISFSALYTKPRKRRRLTDLGTEGRVIGVECRYDFGASRQLGDGRFDQRQLPLSMGRFALPTHVVFQNLLQTVAQQLDAVAQRTLFATLILQLGRITRYSWRCRPTAMPRKKAPEWPPALLVVNLPLPPPPTHTLPQMRLQHLPARIARQRLLTHHQILRDFEIGQALARESQNIARVRLGAGPDHDHRAHFLAHHLVGHADHRDLKDGGVRGQRALNFHAIDVLAAAVDHVFLSVHDPDEAVGIVARPVVRARPAIHEEIGSGFGLVPISLHHVGTAHQ